MGVRFEEFRERAEVPASEYFERDLVHLHIDFPGRGTEQWEWCILV